MPIRTISLNTLYWSKILEMNLRAKTPLHSHTQHRHAAHTTPSKQEPPPASTRRYILRFVHPEKKKIRPSHIPPPRPARPATGRPQKARTKKPPTKNNTSSGDNREKKETGGEKKGRRSTKIMVSPPTTAANQPSPIKKEALCRAIAFILFQLLRSDHSHGDGAYIISISNHFILHSSTGKKGRSRTYHQTPQNYPSPAPAQQGTPQNCTAPRTNTTHQQRPALCP